MTEATHASSRPRPWGTTRLAALAGAALVGAVVLTGLLTAPQTAVAHEPEVVELSADGVVYTRELSDLFGRIALSPLDHASDSFWVRNSGAEPAYLAVGATGIQVSDPDLLGALTLTAGTAKNPGPPVPLAGVGPCVALVSGEILLPGQATEVVSTLALGNLDGGQGQHGHIGFTLRVTLSDATSVEAGAAACPGSRSPDALAPSDDPAREDRSVGVAHTSDHRGGPLASTGVAVATLVGATATLLLVGLAAWFAARFAARRRREEDDPADSGMRGPGAYGDDGS